jgi:hypothetical protein
MGIDCGSEVEYTQSSPTFDWNAILKPGETLVILGLVPGFIDNPVLPRL